MTTLQELLRVSLWQKVYVFIPNSVVYVLDLVIGGFAITIISVQFLKTFKPKHDGLPIPLLAVSNILAHLCCIC